MKVLLDENLDHALRNLLGPHGVGTASYMGWAGLKNGDLLQTGENDRRRIGVVALEAMQPPIIKGSLPAVITANDNAALV